MGHRNRNARAAKSDGRRSGERAARSRAQHPDRLLVSRKDLRAISGHVRSRDAHGRRLQCWAKPRGRVEPFRPGGQRAVGRRLHQSHRHPFDARLRDLNHATVPATQERQELERRGSGDFTRQMTTIYSARWVVPVSAAPIENGAVAVEGQRIAGVGPETEIVERFPEFKVERFGEAIILPGLVNLHTHLELTAMRGYLENEETDFFAWLRKLTRARLELMTPDDIRVSATWGACEAVRAGITCVGDASDAGMMSMMALRDVGLRGVVYQESFGPDARLAEENFGKLKTK